MGKAIPERPQVTITHELIRLEPCPPPAGAETCALYRFEANTGSRRVTVGEQVIAYTYELAGTGRFSLTGQLVGVEARLEGSVAFGDQPAQVLVAADKPTRPGSVRA